jgi:DNA-binding IclR family transcriptional regulator
VKEIARCFLAGAGMTLRGELARVTGLSRPEAGRGNLTLVEEGYATRLERGVYRLTTFEAPPVGAASDPGPSPRNSSRLANRRHSPG